MESVTDLVSKIVSTLDRRGISAVVFDVGGVFIRLRAEEARRELAAELGVGEVRLQEILSSRRSGWKGESLLSVFGVGRISEDDFLSTIVRESGGGTVDMVKKFHLAELLGEDVQMTGFITKLCQRFPVSCFSNTNKTHWDYLLARHEVFKGFRFVMASHLCGVAKPAQNAFLYMASVVGVPIERILFIDDRRDNIEGALGAGGHAVLFTEYDALVEELSR